MDERGVSGIEAVNVVVLYDGHFSFGIVLTNCRCPRRAF